jgi:hypothetical protein
MLNLKTSPETMIMLLFAVIIDCIGIALICFGLDDVGITDTVAMIFIGSWLLFRKGVNVKLGKKDAIRGARFLGATIAEYIPYVGALPFWTGSVLLTLNEKDAPEEESVTSQEEVSSNEKNKGQATA